MIKLVYCLRRLPKLSREEFHKYWYENHGPLVRSKKDILKIRRYVQVHTLDVQLGGGSREPVERTEPFDGVAELWWDSLEEFQGGADSPERQAAGLALYEDELKFIDIPRSPVWIAEERPIIEG